MVGKQGVEPCQRPCGLNYYEPMVEDATYYIFPF